jgi:hypothetical protein
VIQLISEHKQGVVFMLWGNYARAKEAIIDTSKHHVLKAPHPSPLSASRGFFGCGHFSKTNILLNQRRNGCHRLEPWITSCYVLNIGVPKIKGLRSNPLNLIRVMPAKGRV